MSIPASYRPILIAAAFLFLFAITGSGLVSFTYTNTQEQIAENHRLALLNSINELIAHDRYDNNIFTDIIEVTDPELLGSDQPVPIYRARKNGWPIAAVLSPIAPDGYNGAIRLLVAINVDGMLAGVRVIQHRETPGLGDAIEIEKSNWIKMLDARSLSNTSKEEWRVKRDGGLFDQLTGATITPRAVIKAVRNALLYYDAHRQDLFEQAPETNQQP